MGEEKRRRKSHRLVFEACPWCVYCGGATAASTIDHMPPRIMFRGKLRPKGLEFACCERCNRGTKAADLVASLLGRGFPDGNTEQEHTEFKGRLSAINNNIPGLLQEMHIGRAGQKLARKNIPALINGGFLRVDGPIVSSHMQQFATKLGYALFYETTKSIIPLEGAVTARWFSNAEKFAGKFPDQIFEILGPDATLKNGKRDVSDQFGYSWRLAEDGNMGVFFAAFRQSFSVVAFASTDASKFAVEIKHAMRVIRPNELVSLVAHISEAGHTIVPS